MANDPIPDLNHLRPYPHNPDQFAAEPRIRAQLQVMSDERPTLLGFLHLPVLPEIGSQMTLQNQFDATTSVWRVVSMEEQRERDPNAHFEDMDLYNITVEPAV